MPLWLQLTAALSAALASGLMGAALVPFLRRLRMCVPEEKKSGTEEAAGEQLRPTMGGLLLCFGCLTGFVLGFALYQTFCDADRTSLSFQKETAALACMVGYAVCSGAAGFVLDWLQVKRRALQRPSPVMEGTAVLLLHLALLMLWHHTAAPEQAEIMDFGFWKWDAGVLYIPITALLLTGNWLAASSMEEETDGVSVSVGGILLLFVTVILMELAQPLQAVYPLSAAGACMGCLVWNLHPAKCRIGRTGTQWLAAAVLGSILLSGQYLTLFVLPAVYWINLLPKWQKTDPAQGGTLQKRIRRSCMNPWQCIGLLAGFAAVCGIAAILAYK